MNDESRFDSYLSDLKNDPKKREQFLQNILGPPHQTIEGKERDHVLLLIALIEPYSTSNNQHSWTSCYMIGSNDYHVTTCPGEEEIVNLMLLDNKE